MTHPSFQRFMTHKSAIELNDDLEKVSHWAYQQKMQLNPDLNKEANEVILS